MYIIVQRGFLENVHEVIAKILGSVVATLGCSRAVIAVQAFAAIMHQEWIMQIDVPAHQEYEGHFPYSRSAQKS